MSESCLIYLLHFFCGRIRFWRLSRPRCGSVTHEVTRHNRAVTRADRRESHSKGRVKINGEPAWIRTRDPHIKSVLLYQLSYRPIISQQAVKDHENLVAIRVPFFSVYFLGVSSLISVLCVHGVYVCFSSFYVLLFLFPLFPLYLYLHLTRSHCPYRIYWGVCMSCHMPHFIGGCHPQHFPWVQEMRVSIP